MHTYFGYSYNDNQLAISFNYLFFSKFNGRTQRNGKEKLNDDNMTLGTCREVTDLLKVATIRCFIRLILSIQ